MKLKHLFTTGALFVTTLTWSVADDSMKSSKPMRKEVTTVRKEVAEEIRGDRELEIRLGPRINEVAGSFQDGVVRSLLFSTGGTVGGLTLPGTPKTQVDIRRDLGHDEVGPGAQLDIDWKPFKTFDVGADWTKNIHLGLDYKFDQSNASKPCRWPSVLAELSFLEVRTCGRTLIFIRLTTRSVTTCIAIRHSKSPRLLVVRP